MGNLTGFLNAIARNSVLFLLVFYFQGARGEDPVTAGIMLAPLAIGLIVLSPISGILADRYGSRALATAGMVITGLGLLGLMTLDVATPYWQVAFWQLVVGAGSGVFNSPNTSAVMGVVPPNKRGVGAGMRMMLMQSGFVVSIALAIGLVTSSMDPKVMVAIFSGEQIGGKGISLDPFMNALHLAFLAGVLASALGAVVSLMRGEHRSYEGALPALEGEVRTMIVGGRVRFIAAGRALRHRNFRLFFFGQLVSVTGTWMQSVALGWLLVTMVGSNQAIVLLGLLGVAQFMPVLVLGLFGGMIADIWPKRYTVIGTQTVAGILALTLGALVYFHEITIWQIFVLAFLLGLVNAVDMPSRQSFVVEMVGPEDVTNAVALNSAVFNGARVVGPMIAGILIAVAGTALMLHPQWLELCGRGDWTAGDA